MTPRLTFLSLLALSLSACGDPKPQTSASDGSSGGSASSGDGTDSTLGMSSAPTTDDTLPGTATGGSDSQTGDVVTTGVATTDSAGSATSVGPDETGGTTTGGGIDPALCASVCETFVGCQVMDDQDACVAGCHDSFDTNDGACLAAETDLLTCVAAMTCDEANAFLNQQDPGPCAPQLDAEDSACSGQECTTGIGTNENGTECEVTQECPDAPVLKMACDAKLCTCFSDDMKTGECPSDDVCATIEHLDAKSVDCCGF